MNISNSFEEFIVNPQGDGDIEKRIGNLQQMVKVLSQIHNSYPSRELLSFNIIIIVDDKKKEAEFKAKFENNYQLKIEIFSLGENQLEDIYPDEFITEFILRRYKIKMEWDKSILINEFLSNSLGINGKDKGLFKFDLAEFVSEKIRNKNDLENHLPELSRLLIELSD